MNDDLRASFIKGNILDCRKCNLRWGCQKPVPGGGSLSTARVMLIGDNPSQGESRTGTPFTGKIGRELDVYLALADLGREDVYLTNVTKCPANDKKDIKEEHVNECTKQHLKRELELFRGSVIVAMGAAALEQVVPGVGSIDLVHGIPRRARVHGRDVWVLPVLHPGLGLHQTSRISRIRNDFAVLGDLLDGVYEPVKDQIGDRVNYAEVDADTVWDHAAECGGEWLFVDTETAADGSGQFVQYARHGGEGFMFRAENADALEAFRIWVEETGVTTVFHNAAFDLRVLKRIGVRPARYADSMVAAYLLQDLPQGLKALAYRLCGMDMHSYADLTAEATQQKLFDYMIEASLHDYPKPDPTPEYNIQTGEFKVKQPHSVATKLKTKLTAVGKKGLDLKDGGVDLYDSFSNFSDEETALMAERVGERWRRADLADVDPEKALWYSCRDADATARVWGVIWPRLESMGKGMIDTFWTDMEVLGMAIDMMDSGFKVDPEVLDGLDEEWEGMMEDLLNQIEDLTGAKINPQSSPQVGKLLYQQLKMPVLFRTDTGAPSTGDDALAIMEDQHACIPLIRSYRQLNKLRGTYAQPIARMARRSRDQRIHADIKTTRVPTGRLACGEPNLMAIPKRSEQGIRIRDAFVAADGCTLVSRDYGQIEARIAAHEANDPMMIDIFQRGVDIHTKTASEIWGVPMDQVDKNTQRTPAKTVLFGVMYQMSAKGLLDQLKSQHLTGWTEDKCQELIDNWFKVFRGVRQLFTKRHKEAIRNGYIKDMFGRIYRIPEVYCTDKRVQEEGRRYCCSYGVQGPAQGVMKRAMIQMIPIVADFRSQGWICNPLLQIHDDLVFEVSDEIVEEFDCLFEYTMNNAVALKVPLTSDPSFGKVWGQME